MDIRTLWTHLTQRVYSWRRREPDQRMTTQVQHRARSPTEAIRQRAARRRAGMTAEERAWERASLHRDWDPYGDADS